MAVYYFGLTVMWKIANFTFSCSEHVWW